MAQENAEAVKNPKFGEKSIKRVSPVDGDGHHVHQRRSHVAVKEEWKNSGEKKNWKKGNGPGHRLIDLDFFTLTVKNSIENHLRGINWNNPSAT